jgi:hypothetical protein
LPGQQHPVNDIVWQYFAGRLRVGRLQDNQIGVLNVAVAVAP